MIWYVLGFLLTAALLLIGGIVVTGVDSAFVGFG